MIIVFTPTYNRPEKLLRAVKSFRRQVTSVKKRLVIFDNGCDVPVSFPDSDIEVFRSPENVNPVVGGNSAMTWFLGEDDVATVLYDDDYFPEQDSLQTRVEPILRGDADVVYTDAEDFGISRRKYITNLVDMKRLKKSDCIYAASLAWSHYAWQKAGPMDEDMWLQSDWLFKLRLFKHCECVYVPEITVMCETHETQESYIQKWRKQKEDEMVRNIMREGRL